MTLPVLTIGSRNYSSWSLRAWLALALSRCEFQVRQVSLYTPRWRRERASMSPSGLVPVLEHGPLRVWDSLAICEYAAETFAGAPGWPPDAAARALARSVSAEMHSGFAALRTRLPMNCRRRVPGFRPGPEASADIERVRRIWSGCLEASGGPWLFGAEITIADVMFAPVAVRFRGYDVALAAGERDYAERLLAVPQVQQWVARACEETQVIQAFEVPA